jgi:NDP-sugar pyrophosphorylase family protein
MRTRYTLESRHLASEAAVTIALREAPDLARYVEVVIDAGGRILSFSEKGRRGRRSINGGVYLIDGRVWFDGHFENAFSFERDYLQRRAKTEALHGYQAGGYLVDIGIPEVLERARCVLGRL